jgi:hypothetical protein
MDGIRTRNHFISNDCDIKNELLILKLNVNPINVSPSLVPEYHLLSPMTKFPPLASFTILVLANRHLDSLTNIVPGAAQRPLIHQLEPCGVAHGNQHAHQSSRQELHPPGPPPNCTHSLASLGPRGLRSRPTAWWSPWESSPRRPAAARRRLRRRSGRPSPDR